MLIEVEGDILLSKADAICHGIAPNDNFTNGLALSLREQWPAMYKDFRHFCQSQHPKAGTLWTWSGPGHARIVNLFTQEAAYDAGSKPGKATIVNLNHCFRELKKEVKSQGIKSLAITKVATGVGGLAWKDVSALMKESLSDIGIPVYLYTSYKKGVSAEEKAK